MKEFHHIKITEENIQCPKVNTFINYVKIFLDNKNTHIITGTSVYKLSGKNYSKNDKHIILNLIQDVRNFHEINNRIFREIVKIDLL